jgi:hypothetical protein
MVGAVRKAGKVSKATLDRRVCLAMAYLGVKAGLEHKAMKANKALPELASRVFLERKALLVPVRKDLLV